MEINKGTSAALLGIFSSDRKAAKARELNIAQTQYQMSQQKQQQQYQLSQTLAQNRQAAQTIAASVTTRKADAQNLVTNMDSVIDEMKAGVAKYGGNVMRYMTAEGNDKWTSAIGDYEAKIGEIKTNEAEIANAAAGAKNKATAVLAYLLKKGFLPTQIADSFAISSGGAAFYRNRVNSYVKQGMDQKAAEEKAMTDFREITEENQQSSRPDRISKQQASPLGRVILAFQNTPMQYARIIKKSVADIVAGRGDLKTHVSKIIYYGGVQSLIFGAMQNALFALAFDDEEDDKNLTKTELEKKQKKRDTQYERTLNTMLDSLLNGSGLTGRVLSTVKNVIFKFLQEKDKGWNSDMGNVAIEAANISPPLGSKLRKMKKAGDVYDWNQKVIDEMDTFDINNPIWEAGANVIESTTNVPAARAIKKLESIREAFNQNNETWQRIAVAMGWSQWDLGIEGQKRQAVQETKEYLKKKKKDEKAKSKKRTVKKSSSKDTYFNKVIKSRKNEASKVKGGEYRCTALTQDLSQCKNRTDNSSRKCFLHN